MLRLRRMIPGSAVCAGSLVVLKLPELPLFDEARAISAQDQLTLTVERAESGRLLLASRDKLIRGWIYDDEVVPLDLAIDYFSQALIRDRSNLEDYWVLGRLWSYRNDNVRALVFLKRAIGRFSDQPRFFLSRGLAYLRTGKLRESLEDCERAVRLDPESSKARRVRHQAGHAAVDRAAAIAVVDQAFKDDPTDPTGLKGGAAPIAAEHEVASVDEVEAGDLESHVPARLVPRTAAEFLASGERWFDEGEYDKAISDYNAALKLDPRLARAYVSRGRAWVQKHYRERELADIDSAISIEPRNATFRVARAESWSARGMNAPAMADYAEAIRLDPENPAIWVSRGNEWRKDHKVNQALADYTRAIGLDPKYVPAYIARANTWKQIRRFDYTIQELSNLIRINPQEPVRARDPGTRAVNLARGSIPGRQESP